MRWLTAAPVIAIAVSALVAANRVGISVIRPLHPRTACQAVGDRMLSLENRQQCGKKHRGQIRDVVDADEWDEPSSPQHEDDGK